jgi:hypothetical protein
MLKHKVIGEFAYLPIYLLEEDDLGSNNEFNSPKGTILLGGGGGEHPALSIINHNYCVLNYLIDRLEYCTSEEFCEENETANKIYELLDLKEFKDLDVWNNLQFNNWGMDQIARLVKYKESFDPSNDITAENWLNSEIGKTIVEKYPELNNYIELSKNVEKTIDKHFNDQNQSIETR